MIPLRGEILGVEGEAVVLYREPSIIPPRRDKRRSKIPHLSAGRCGILGLSASGGLSRRVNKMAVFSGFQDATYSAFQQSIKNERIACIYSFQTHFAILFMQLTGKIMLD